MMILKTSARKALASRLQEFTHYAELRQVAFNLAALQQEKKFHSLAVLSFFPAEGKTLFCAAMARAYADACRSKVLIVDTTTNQNKGSLLIEHCFEEEPPMTELVSLEVLRRNSNGAAVPPPGPGFPGEKARVLVSDIVKNRSANGSEAKESDFALIQKTIEDPSRQYGLVLVDTAPLHARNRSNIDPLLMARMSQASVLVVSRKLLDSPHLNTSLKILEDPALHLIGMVSNEEYCP